MRVISESRLEYKAQYASGQKTTFLIVTGPSVMLAFNTATPFDFWHGAVLEHASQLFREPRLSERIPA